MSVQLELEKRSGDDLICIRPPEPRRNVPIVERGRRGSMTAR